MSSCDDPFRKMDKSLTKISAKVILRRFSLARQRARRWRWEWYLDGRVDSRAGDAYACADVQDEQATVQNAGTAYQTDVGMSSPFDSVISVRNATWWCNAS